MQQKHPTISELIDRLYAKIKLLGSRSFFNSPASDETIRRFEFQANIQLPDNIRQFYLHFNGGFFAMSDWMDDDFLNDKANLGNVRWNSNYILSIEDMLLSYHNEDDMIMFDIQERGKYVGKRLFPLLHTEGQEMLVIDLSDITKDTPILDACHELNSNEWGVLYPSFEDLLSDYIDKNGNIETIASLSNWQ